MSLNHIKHMDTLQFIEWLDAHLREEIVYVARRWAGSVAEIELYAAWGHVLDRFWSKSLLPSAFESEDHLRRHCGKMLKTYVRYGWGSDADKYRHRINGREYFTRLLSQCDDETQVEAMLVEVDDAGAPPDPPEWLVGAMKRANPKGVEAMILLDLAGWTRAEAGIAMDETPTRVAKLASRARSVIRAAAPEGFSPVG